MLNKRDRNKLNIIGVFQIRILIKLLIFKWMKRLKNKNINIMKKVTTLFQVVNFKGITKDLINIYNERKFENQEFIKQNINKEKKIFEINEDEEIIEEEE